MPQKLRKTVDVEEELGWLDALQYADITTTGYVFKAISLTRKKLDGSATLIGFCGGPVRTSLTSLLTRDNSGP